MPDLQPGSEYLVAFLHSAGTASSTGMGLSGLSWQEIEAWVRCTDNTIARPVKRSIGRRSEARRIRRHPIATPRDLKTIHMLSRVYAGEYYKAGLKGATAPYVKKLEVVEETRAIISDKAESLFAGLIANQTKG